MHLLPFENMCFASQEIVYKNKLACLCMLFIKVPICRVLSCILHCMFPVAIDNLLLFIEIRSITTQCIHLKDLSSFHSCLPVVSCVFK